MKHEERLLNSKGSFHASIISKLVFSLISVPCRDDWLVFCKEACLMNHPDCAECWQVSLAKWRWAIYGFVSVPHSDSWIKVSICSSLSRCWKTSHLFTFFVLCCLTLGLHACLVVMLWKGFQFSVFLGFCLLCFWKYRGFHIQCQWKNL